MEIIDHKLRNAVSQGIFPGGVCLVKKRETILFHEAYGLANVYTARKIEKETLFDLASLTKPLATAIALMVLHVRHEITFDTKISHIIPEFGLTDKDQITIGHLLLHTSGLPNYQPYYLKLEHKTPELRTHFLHELLVKEQLVNQTGSTVNYSDIGFMILRWCIETITGMSLNDFLREEVYDPLQIKHLMFSVNHELNIQTSGVAATEQCPWRNFLLEGTVHDENAYIVGGVEGHAGLFGSASAICDLLSYLLSIYHNRQSHLITPPIVQLFFHAHKRFNRGYGFDTPAEHGSSSGRLFGKKTIGHLGFTGTSFWIDLEKSIQIIFLTNRIHPVRHNNQIKMFRPLIHDTIMEII